MARSDGPTETFGSGSYYSTVLDYSLFVRIIIHYSTKIQEMIGSGLSKNSGNGFSRTLHTSLLYVCLFYNRDGNLKNIRSTPGAGPSIFHGLLILSTCTTFSSEGGPSSRFYSVSSTLDLTWNLPPNLNFITFSFRSFS